MKDILKDGVTRAFIALALVVILGVVFLPLYVDYWGGIIAQLLGLVCIIVSIVFCYRTYKLYGLKSNEGRVWMLFAVSLLLIALGQIAATFGWEHGLALLRFIAAPLIVLGFAIKLKFAGIKMDARSASVTYIALLPWIVLVFLASFYPAYGGGGIDVWGKPDPVFALLDLFIILSLILILQLDVTAKGWIPLAWGMAMVAVADIFIELLKQNTNYYLGHPFDLLWYLGLLLIGYGAYYQRKIHMELMEF